MWRSRTRLLGTILLKKNEYIDSWNLDVECARTRTHFRFTAKVKLSIRFTTCNEYRDAPKRYSKVLRRLPLLYFFPLRYRSCLTRMGFGILFFSFFKFFIYLFIFFILLLWFFFNCSFTGSPSWQRFYWAWREVRTRGPRVFVFQGWERDTKCNQGPLVREPNSTFPRNNASRSYEPKKKGTSI